MDDNVIAISALQHYAYCPRQFALIHVEQAWEENRYTAEGNLLHERVDTGVAETRNDIRYERSVLLRSERYGLTGKMDLLEIIDDDPPKNFPVEYKRGKPKIEDWDRIQVCAQALCLEEMRGININEGALWYWEVRRREPIAIDEQLRATTIDVIERARKVLVSGQTPPPTENKKRCRACSLVNLCEPDTFRNDCSATYVKEMLDGEETP